MVQTAADHAPPLILHVFPTFAVGGAQRRFAAVANHFGERWRHAIIALDGVTDCRSLLSDLDVTFITPDTHKGDLLGNLRGIRRLVRTLRPAVLVTSNWGSIEWAIANLIPLAHHIHTEDGFGPEERAVQLGRRVWTRRLALWRSTVVLPSQTLMHIARDVWRLPSARLRYIPNGIDLARYAGHTDRPTGTRREPVIGIVAALRPEKNISRLVRTFHRTGISARLIIVGDGSERAALEALTVQLGIADRVEFLGYVGDPERLYASFDLFALSSDTEQMPLSILEAMAARLPVVATDVGDIRSMVSNENRAFIVPTEDEALSAALRTLLTDLPLCRRLGAANRLKAERDYDENTMFLSYGELWAGQRASERDKPLRILPR